MNGSLRRGILMGMGLALAAPAYADFASMLGNTCAGCHGLNGTSAGETMPRIAGLPREFILFAMKEYRDGTRGSTIMGRIAKGYNDQQLAAIADFFSRQKWQSAAQRFDPQASQRGEKLHLKRCEACHRDNGTSMALEMQPLAGQWAGYLKIYLETCRDPQWKLRHPDAMTVICHDLDAKDMEALVNFYASQK